MPIERLCPICITQFLTFPSKIKSGRGVYCSKKCFRLSNGQDVPPEQRLWKFIDKTTTPDGCWPFIGYCNKDGYGQLRAYGRMIGAHKFAYETLHGPVQPGILICHTCDNPPCCRDEHLFPGTHTDNIQDAIAKGRFVFADTAKATAALMANPSCMPRGIQHHNSHLTEADIYAIRALQGKMTQRAIAEQFDLDQSTVWAILHRRTWPHVP